VKLADFKKSGGRTGARFLARITDEASGEEFEMTIAGPTSLVERMLAEAEIDVAIDSERTRDHVMADFDPALEEQRRSLWEEAALDDTATFFKPTPAPRQPETTVVAAIRPVAGHGTPFALRIFGFSVAASSSFFFIGLPVATAAGALVPLSGDQDLFMHFFAPLGPTLASSRAGGTSLDFVFFMLPAPWVPVFEVQGFTTGVCREFRAQGA
jgi:hypothetical protein